MNDQTNETTKAGMFAVPCKDIFVKERHVGRIYRWSDGPEVAHWFDEPQSLDGCVMKTYEISQDGWQKFFSAA